MEVLIGYVGFTAIHSISALVGRILARTLEFGPYGLWLLPAGLLDATKLSATRVRRVLEIIVTIAAGTWLNALFA